MTTAAMRAIDRFIGVPLCVAAGTMHRAFGGRPGDPDDRPGRPAVFIKFFGIGSILRTAPAIARYRALNPKRSIAYVSFTQHREAVELIDGVDTGFYVDPSNPFSFALSALRTLLSLRRLRPAVVLDFEFFSKFSTLLASASGAPRRAGLDLPARWRRWNLTHPYADSPALPAAGQTLPGSPRPVVAKGRHVSELFAGMVEAVGPSGRQGNDRAPADGARAAHGAGRPAGSPGNGLRSGINRLDGNRPVPGPYICVNVNAGNVYLERRWPRERFSEAVGILAGSHPEVTFVFTGTAAERSYTQGAIPAHLSGRCVNAAGDYSIRKLASLFAGAELVISCDSGPLHLADMLGVPCIGIYGPETPTFYGVTGEASVRLYKPVSCSPCMNLYDARSFRCPYNARCMDEIAPGDLVEAVETLTALSGEPQAHTPVGSLQALTPGI